MFSIMRIWTALSLCLIPCVVSSNVLPQVGSGDNRTSGACPELAKSYPEQLFYPESWSYVNESAAVYSKNCVLSPDCVFVPRTADDVAKCLQVLVRTKTRFAVKGAGHMPIRGAQSTNHGVMIAMSNLTTALLAKSNTVLKLGPGHAWEQVYDFLARYNLTVVGGRYGPVGVGGLLLGGGYDFFGNQRGWAMNSVVNYQVVLANSTIVNANSKHNPDLFWALKGGANNFGIVTRFDLKTYSSGKVFGGTMSFNSSITPMFLQAVTRFFQPDGGVNDVNVALNPCIFPSTSEKTTSSNLVAFDLGGHRDSAVLRNFTSLPASSKQIGEYESFDLFTKNPNINLEENRANNHLYWATSIYPTPHAIRILNETVTEAVFSSPDLAKVKGSSVGLCMQPVTTEWQQAARHGGGDAIDLDPANGSFLAVILPASWTDVSDSAFMHSFVGDIVASIEAKARKAALYYPFVYLNDAARGQQVFKHYGAGKSLPRMQAISRAVDPNGVFQTLIHGPFKLGMY